MARELLGIAFGGEHTRNLAGGLALRRKGFQGVQQAGAVYRLARAVTVCALEYPYGWRVDEPHLANTVRNVWQMLDRVLEYAYEHKAIGAVPTDVIDRSAAHYAVGDDTGFEPHPLSAQQVAALAAKVGERYPVYELLALFMAYTGLRAAEVQGLEVRDLVLTTGPDGSTRGSVRVQRTKSRRKREWVTGTPKSKTSKRTVPLPPWLATRLAAYLADTHPAADTPTAVLWPRRLHGNHVVVPPLDWSAPCDLNGVQSKIIRPPWSGRHVAAVPEPSSHLDKVDACGKPRAFGSPYAVRSWRPNAIGGGRHGAIRVEDRRAARAQQPDRFRR